ncbi:MAG: hypothetical protein ACREGK_00450 [Geminicoccales bacterium]
MGFARVDLEPGESKSIEFAVLLSLLAYTGLSSELVMDPGPGGGERGQQLERHPVERDAHRSRRDSHHPR